MDEMMRLKTRKTELEMEVEQLAGEAERLMEELSNYSDEKESLMMAIVELDVKNKTSEKRLGELEDKINNLQKKIRKAERRRR